jgi:CO/xanthine dehydrogenase FAD-binding subunit
MKPANFTYLRPKNIDEALKYLAEYGEDAKILSGGQSLIPILNMRLSTPQYLVDIGRIEDLSYIRDQGDYLAIGAATKHIEIEQSALVKESCPILYEGIQWIGHTQIRNRGTVGGSIAHADSSAELPCILSALRGKIILADVDGEEAASPEEFFLTYMLTSIRPDQLVKEVRFPKLQASNGWAFVELARRHGDFAMVEVACVVELNNQGKIESCRMAAGGANPVPCVLELSEDFLIGKYPSEEVIREAGEIAMDMVDPDSDLHGSAEYRRSLTGVMVQRAIKAAVDRARKVRNDE